MANITPKLKDSVLAALCEYPLERFSRISKQPFIDSLAISNNELVGIMSQFNRMGLISDYADHRSIISFCLRLDAIEFFRSGGFTAREELLAKEIQKLLLEIEGLKPTIPDRVSTITTIAANIATALGLIVPK